MPSEKIGAYEVEYSAVPAADGKGWVAHVAVYGHSTNPMHRNCIFPDQRVSLESVFKTSEEAEAEARRAAAGLLDSHSSRSGAQ
ncbi:hypothetical protein [Herminiimonas fonticola]|uniref:Uncharacterized protein n=1 Tax=Herminiimonas fonticola TaxID=303380 RepID=A0A4R6G7G6_9BURK|nr:hypothetical protein [Herminiimonas fonticola]RBA23930.1 hypothetical protein Hfont_1742 [Herminiimonas fonticola]TDN89930.1 hypothetical protein EV677_1999 [Herminiimonas fonticola]